MLDLTWWGWFAIYWGCCYALCLNWMAKNAQKAGVIGLILLLFFSLLFPILFLCSFVGKLLKGNKDDSE